MAYEFIFGVPQDDNSIEKEKLTYQKKDTKQKADGNLERKKDKMSSAASNHEVADNKNGFGFRYHICTIASFDISNSWKVLSILSVFFRHDFKNHRSFDYVFAIESFSSNLCMPMQEGVKVEAGVTE